MRERAPFANRMTGTQTIIGWCYLPFHMFVLPVLLSLYAAFSPGEVSEVGVNLVYELIGLAFVLAVMFRFLRAGFDSLADRPGRCLLGLAIAFVANYILSFVAAIILMQIESGGTNPNETAVESLAAGSGMFRALAVFIGPVVEETLFRGVAFGSLRNRSRILAYAVSALLFGVFHVWQYALLYDDARLLLYALQYLPASLALAWCYEYTESIWTPIFLHMIINAIAFTALTPV